MNSTKRKYKRHKTTTPATIRSGGHTLAATTRDVSLGGLFIFTDAALREGSEIEVVLMLPKELGLPASQMVCCHGKIVRSEIVDGQHGVGLTGLSRFRRPEFRIHCLLFGNPLQPYATVVLPVAA